MVKKKQFSSAKQMDRENCRHYWLIGRPIRGTTKGICKFCGKEREFLYHFEDHFRKDTNEKSSQEDISTKS